MKPLIMLICICMAAGCKEKEKSTTHVMTPLEIEVAKGLKLVKRNFDTSSNPRAKEIQKNLQHYIDSIEHQTDPVKLPSTAELITNYRNYLSMPSDSSIFDMRSRKIIQAKLDSLELEIK